MKSLKSLSLGPLPVQGVANCFPTTLQSGQIENFESHFQEDPQGFNSVGDENTIEYVQPFCTHYVVQVAAASDLSCRTS